MLWAHLLVPTTLMAQSASNTLRDSTGTFEITFPVPYRDVTDSKPNKTGEQRFEAGDFKSDRWFLFSAGSFGNDTLSREEILSASAGRRKGRGLYCVDCGSLAN
jgi:hypothetical protein